jgi:hypothetical protein
VQWCEPCLRWGRGRFPAIANVEGTPECEYCHRGEARPDVAQPQATDGREARPDITTIVVIRPPCACGCGDLVGIPGENYIPGHAPRHGMAKPEKQLLYG